MSPMQPPSADESILSELQQLVEMADDENVEQIVGMSKERLLTVLDRDIGEGDEDLSDDLRGKLARLFEREEADAAEEAGEFDQTIDALSRELGMYLEEDAVEGRTVMTEAERQLAHVLAVAEREADKEFRTVETAQNEDEQGQIEDIRASLRGNTIPQDAPQGSL